MRSPSVSLVLLGAVLFGGVSLAQEDVAPAEEEGTLVPSVSTEARAALGLGTSALAACDDVATWDPAWAGFEAEVLTLVNQHRVAGAVCGGVTKAPAPALVLDTKLQCAARRHSKDMGTNNFMSHTGSNGSTPWQRITDAGYAYRRAAENVAAGYSTPAAVVAGWMASSGHCTNIMNPQLVHLGVGYFHAPNSTYRHYWTQDFGAL
ncbi:CAP domain-containing protein [Myxococcus sp. K15C18031901]|uniref:CAP domain-containing protein n=1 Tax=Myxococcus dinghuensis TaxID=2906761 RepID=UPI0020A6E762|nr:CAP domain-containing protein [Myxococcus dinghuensis]MCP3100209.1 CAP domain-containing protein [Myxococcus dinghuensis]